LADRLGERRRDGRRRGDVRDRRERERRDCRPVVREREERERNQADRGEDEDAIAIERGTNAQHQPLEAPFDRRWTGGRLLIEAVPLVQPVTDELRERRGGGAVGGSEIRVFHSIPLVPRRTRGGEKIVPVVTAITAIFWCPSSVTLS